jgi:hypothetical protein
VSTPSRRQVVLLIRARSNEQARLQAERVERLIQSSAARGIHQIEQHLKEVAGQ